MLMEGPVQTNELVLNVPLMSKARPRSMAGRSVPYMPPAYKKWKKGSPGTDGRVVGR